MKRAWLFALMFSLACQKELDPVATEPEVVYLIRAGQQFSDNNPVTPFESMALNFSVRFDSSAIYTTILPDNQLDINKLYGFSDNNGPHHEFSARFGWRWSHNRLSLHAYVYNNGTRESKEIAPIDIGRVYQCRILVSKNTYLFSLGGTNVSMPRQAATVKGTGYKLYPFFGGDETAPHDIRVYIREHR